MQDRSDLRDLKEKPDLQVRKATKVIRDPLARRDFKGFAAKQEPPVL
jgi:hypothetical protein